MPCKRFSGPMFTLSNRHNRTVTRPIGKHNPKLSAIRKALGQGALTPDGRLALEGPHLLEEAVRSGIAVEELFLSGDTPIPAKVRARLVHRVPEAAFRTMAQTRESQGVIGLVVPPPQHLDRIFGRTKSGPILVLCGLQDPGNAGTILRSAEAFGAAGVVATPRTVGWPNDKLVRASAGSLLRLPLAWDTPLDHFAEKARKNKIRIAGAAADGHTDLDAADFTIPTAILIGREGLGLDPGERKHADFVFRIPMANPVESLNAATAAAVILYEAARKRKGRTP